MSYRIGLESVFENVDFLKIFHWQIVVHYVKIILVYFELRGAISVPCAER